MAMVDRALVAPPKLRASILAHRKRGEYVFPRAAKPGDFIDFSAGPLRPSLGDEGRYSLRVIMDVVAEMSGSTILAFRSQRRMVKLTRARMILYWLARQHTKLSLPAIGKHIGGRDHSTIINGCRNVEKVILAEGIAVSSDLHVMAKRLLSSRWARTAK